MKAVRHPFVAWVKDGLGEARAKVFDPDVDVGIWGFDPGGSTEPTSQTDTPVVTVPTLYPVEPVRESAHDEWTINGDRYEQDGAEAIWGAPWGGRVESVIRLRRRAG